MKKVLLATVAAAGILALPALAIAQHMGDSHGAPLTRSDLQKQITEHFSMMDANKDGAVTRAEFDAHHEAMRKQWAGKQAERQNERFAVMDTDKSGQISKAEFDAYNAGRGERWNEMRKGPPEGGKPMHGDRDGGRHMGMMMDGMGGDMFAMLDANKDGKVTLAELSARRLAMFDKMDANKDGTVTPEERRAAWGKMRAEKRAAPERPAAPTNK